jgi:hypothetical protein
MAYQVIPEVGEEVALNLEFKVSEKSAPFFLAISNRALYIPRTKLIAKSDPYYFERVPLQQVRHVNVRRLPTYGFWIVAAMMVLVGVVTIYAMLEPLVSREPGLHHVSGWPFAILVGGILMPFAARGRSGLEIWYSGGKFRWKPAMVVGQEPRQKIADTFSSIITACEKVGVPVSDKRAK